MSDSDKVISKRADIVLLFDVQDGNPNGDPDMANSPRFDPETFQGLVSDVALKRKVRDWVFAKMSEGAAPQKGYDVFVLQGHSLESRQRMPFDSLKMEGKGNQTSSKSVEAARAWMCSNFFDVRAFGAVMSTTDFNCGQVRGPVQITFARSFDRVLATEHGITRVAYTREDKTQSTAGRTEMGNKHTVAYGLYCAHAFINPHLARLPSGTGFTERDQKVVLDALVNMWDLDRSAARGMMACRGLYVFEHDNALGNAPAHKLFERVRVRRKPDVEAPRSFSDYDVVIDDAQLPASVKLVRYFE